VFPDKTLSLFSLSLSLSLDAAGDSGAAAPRGRNWEVWV